MTVNELIQLLAAYPPDLRVIVNDYEDGYDDLAPEQLAVVRVALNTGQNRWEGQHGDPNSLTDGTDVVETLVLRRVSN